MDVNGRYITHEHLFRGSLFYTQVSPREVVKFALKHNAAKAIFYHNHPAGCVTPTSSDHNITKILTDILHVVDVMAVDHFILAGDDYYSFAEHGVMPKGTR